MVAIIFSTTSGLLTPYHQLLAATKRLAILSHKFWRVLRKLIILMFLSSPLPLEVFSGVPQVLIQELQKSEAAEIFNTEINTIRGTEFEYPS